MRPFSTPIQRFVLIPREISGLAGFLAADAGCAPPPSYLAQGARVGGAGVSPAVLRRDRYTRIASGRLAPPNPAPHPPQEADSFTSSLASVVAFFVSLLGSA